MRDELIKLLVTAKNLTTLSREADFLIANDVVPVVRCKDCKHFIQEEHGCNHFGYYSYTPWVDEVDFCSYGERKDNV